MRFLGDEGGDVSERGCCCDPLGWFSPLLTHSGPQAREFRDSLAQNLDSKDFTGSEFRTG